MQEGLAMPIKKKFICQTCSTEYIVVYHRSASYPGIVITDLRGKKLSEPLTCQGCKQKRSFNDKGFNPLSLEK